MLALVGPTAAGKSGLAVQVAQELRGEVVNTDAMQLYRGMDIGTAKLPVAQRRGIRHHLVDVLEVAEPASVAEFQTMARAVVDECRRRGVVPVLVGGSVLYTRAVLDEFDFPGTHPGVRRRLERELAGLGPAVLHDRLAHLDPAAAARILPSNGRRVVRALEVMEITGRPFSAVLPEHHYHYPDTVQVGIAAPTEALRERIERRVEQMWDAGFVGEVRRLEGCGLREGRTASRAIGYAQVLDLLDGRIDESEAKERTVRATQRFARRQMSWYRRDPRISWLDWDDPQLLAKAVSLAAQAT